MHDTYLRTMPSDSKITRSPTRTDSLMKRPSRGPEAPAAAGDLERLTTPPRPIVTTISTDHFVRADDDSVDRISAAENYPEVKGGDLHQYKTQ